MIFLKYSVIIHFQALDQPPYEQGLAVLKPSPCGSMWENSCQIRKLKTAILLTFEAHCSIHLLAIEECRLFTVAGQSAGILSCQLCQILMSIDSETT
jgi:hypothetical protein